VSLVDRVRQKRRAERISQRALARITGASFSTLARVERGEGDYGEETARLLRSWLGDDVSEVVSAAERAKAEELGRIMARACSAEILKIINERFQ
jgi:transcriptional regulator with XRE-family HTH domain